LRTLVHDAKRRCSDSTSQSTECRPRIHICHPVFSKESLSTRCSRRTSAKDYRSVRQRLRLVSVACDLLKDMRMLFVSVAFSLMEAACVSISHDKTDASGTRLSGAPSESPLCGHTDMATSVAFSPDGKRLASASDDKTYASGMPASRLPSEALCGHRLSRHVCRIPHLTESDSRQHLTTKQ